MIQSFINSRAISFNPREKFSRSIQLVHPIRRGWKTGTKPNYEHAGAPEVLYDYLTEHAATNGRFVPFKYMIARDFSHSPSSSPPTTLWVRTRPHYSPLQVFHPAAPGWSRFAHGFKKSLPRSRLITEIMGIKNERF